MKATTELISKYTGDIAGYNHLHAVARREKIRELSVKILAVPSHHRLRLFGKDALEFTGLLHTCQTKRIYA